MVWFLCTSVPPYGSTVYKISENDLRAPQVCIRRRWRAFRGDKFGEVFFLARGRHLQEEIYSIITVQLIQQWSCREEDEKK